MASDLVERSRSVKQGQGSSQGKASQAVEVLELRKAPQTPRRRRPSAKKAGKAEAAVDKRLASPERGSELDSQQCNYFERALRYAMVQRSWGVRELGSAIGVEVGTMTKYLRGEVNPYRVGFGIMRHLARELGVTMEALDNYFQSGDFGNGKSAPVTLDQVETWIRTRANAGDLKVLLAAQFELADRIEKGLPATGGHPELLLEIEPEPEPEPYLWPTEALDAREVPQRMRERMGLTDEVLEALTSKGEYTDEVVEAFSVLFDLAEDVLKSAFEQRLSPEQL